MKHVVHILTQIMLDKRRQEIISRLQASRPSAVLPPNEFRSALRARLLTQYDQPHPHGRLWRQPFPMLALGSIVALIITFVWVLGRPANLAAAEIVQRATNVRAVNPGSSEVIYERFLVTVSDAPNSKVIDNLRAAEVEQWYSPDKTQFRYQMTSSTGELLYFVQRNGDQIWRSIHTQPIGSEPVTEVYQGTVQDSVATSTEDLEQSIGLSLLHPVWWKKLACDDLLCLLNQEHAEAKLLKQEHIADGRRVHVVQIDHKLPDADAPTYTLTVKVDTQNYELVEVVEQRDGQQNVHLTQFKRQMMPIAQIAPDFFSALPSALKITNDQLDTSPTETTSDRVWIQSASLPPGTELSERSYLEVEVGYELVTAPKATLSVGVMVGNGFTELANITVHARSDVLRVSLGNRAAHLRNESSNGEMKLGANLYLANGPQSFRILTGTVSDKYVYRSR